MTKALAYRHRGQLYMPLAGQTATACLPRPPSVAQMLRRRIGGPLGLVGVCSSLIITLGVPLGHR